MQHLWWLVSGVLYVTVGVFSRSQQFFWQGAFLLLFVLYAWGAFQACQAFGTSKNRALTIKQWLGIALLLRLALLFALPTLSDDVYRFLWDGWLWHQGISPFSHTPATYAQTIPLSAYASTCFTRMNSPDYISPYPLLHQLIFFLSSWEKLGIPGSILLMRLLHLSLDMLLGWSLIRVLTYLKIETWTSVLYLWNPLVLLEGVGNLHTESYVLLALLLGLLACSRYQVLKASLFFSLGAAVKLLPLLCLPYIFFYFYRHSPSQAWRWSAYTVGFLVLLFVPLFFAQGWRAWEGVALYGELFSFNASLYALGIWIGTWTQAWGLLLLALVLILGTSLWLAYKRTNCFVVVVILYGLYLFCTSTVHPWYILPVLGLAVCTQYRRLLWATQAWSYLILWSYVGYTATGYEPTQGLIIAEYLILALVLIVPYWRIGFLLRRHK